MSKRTDDWFRRLIEMLPDRLIIAIDAWANKPPPPRCPWKSYWGRQCEYNQGHGGQCMTIGPSKRYRWYYGINYEMVEGLPVPRRKT